jgi:hypothetical protein
MIKPLHSIGAVLTLLLIINSRLLLGQIVEQIPSIVQKSHYFYFDRQKAKGNLKTEDKKTITNFGSTFASLTSDVNLYSKEYLREMTVDTVQIKSGVGTLIMSYDEFLSKYGTMVTDSITFKVQVGAYKFIENFDFNKLLQLPAIRRQSYADGITRFTLGEFNTLKQADDMCKLAKKIAIKDAFVIAFYKNKRLSLNNLIKGNYLKN